MYTKLKNVFLFVLISASVLAQKPIDLRPFAKSASPTFTGNPTAPTPTVGDRTTRLATTAFIGEEVALVARPYYVSNTAGGTADGLTEANAMSWTTFIAGLSSVQPGSAIYLNRGEVYVGSVSKVFKGGAGKVTSFQSYGTAYDKPRIKCDVSVSGTWTSLGGSIYRIPYTSPTTKVRQVFFAGVRGRLAQTQAFPITTYTSIQNFTASTLAGVFSSSLVGARVVAKSFGFRFWETAVTGGNIATGNILTAEATIPGASVGVGYSFVLMGQQQFLSSAGALNNDWFYDHAAGFLYVRSATTPTSVTASIYDTGFDFGTGSSYVTVKEIDIENPGQDGIYARDAIRLETENVTVTKPGIAGISAPGFTTYHKHTRLTVDDAAFSGTLYDQTQFTKFDFCSVNNPGMAGNFPTLEDRSRYPICYLYTGYGFAHSPGSREVWHSFSSVKNAAYIGIRLDGPNSQAINCTVDTFCNRLNDGGGIHFWAYPSVTTYGRNWAPYNTRTIIRGNRCFNGVGSIDMIPSGTTKVLAGIYVDNGARDFEITGNLCYDNSLVGIFLGFDTQLGLIDGNLCYNNGRAQVEFYNLSGGANVVTNGMSLNNNVLACLTPDQRCVNVADNANSTTYNPFGSGGGANNNIYVQPYSSNLFSRNNISTNPPTDNLTFAAWKTAYSVDADSRTQSFVGSYTNVATSKNEVKMVLNARRTSSTVNLSAGYKDIDDRIISSVIVPPFYASLAFKPSGLSFSANVLYATYTASNGTAIGSYTPETGSFTGTNLSGTSTIQSNALVSTGANGAQGFNAANADYEFQSLLDGYTADASAVVIDHYHRTAATTALTDRFPCIMFRLIRNTGGLEWKLQVYHRQDAGTTQLTLLDRNMAIQTIATTAQIRLITRVYGTTWYTAIEIDGVAVDSASGTLTASPTLTSNTRGIFLYSTNTKITESRLRTITVN